MSLPRSWAAGGAPFLGPGPENLASTWQFPGISWQKCSVPEDMWIGGASHWVVLGESCGMPWHALDLIQLFFVVFPHG